jgi:hypothetical protein
LIGARSTNGSNGRGAAGRFAAGNPGGPGNPHARRVAAMRAILLEAVTDDDLRAIVAKLVAMAKDGDLAAIRELLDRTLGKSPPAVALDVPQEDEGFFLTVEQRRSRLEAILQTALSKRREEEAQAAIHGGWI